MQRLIIPDGPMVRVEWIARATGKSGHGDWMPSAAAEAAAARGNREYPEITHWVVEAL